jgi:uncharacterized membrane protein YfcA
VPGWLFDPTTVYVVTVIFVATLIRSTLGFGEALVAVPLLSLRTPVTVAAPLAVLVSVLVAGVIVILFSLYSLATRSARTLPADHRGWLAACGFVAGVLGGAYGMNGPPLVLYGTLRGWSPQRFRATLQAYFLPVSMLGLVGYAVVGLWDTAVTNYFLWSLPGVGIATVLGRAINRRMRGDRFVRLVFGGLLLTGTALVLQALKLGPGR